MTKIFFAIRRSFIICLLFLFCFFPSVFTVSADDYLSMGRNETPFPITKWEPIMTCRFDDPAEMSRFIVTEGTWKIKDGKLWAIEGEGNRGILLCHSQGEAVRVELKVTNYADTKGRIGDVSILINTAPEKGYFSKGYAFTTGSYYNTCTTFYRKECKLARTECSPLKPGKSSTVILEQYRGHIRYWVNDRIVLEAWDRDPLPLNEELWVGLRTWATLMAVDSVIISRAAVSAK